MTKRNHYGHKVTPQVSRQKQKEVKKKQVLRKKIITGFVIAILLIQGLSSICGGFLAWYRFAADTRNVRIFKTFMAVIFGIPFMIYFFIVRVVFGRPYP